MTQLLPTSDPLYIYVPQQRLNNSTNLFDEKIIISYPMSIYVGKFPTPGDFLIPILASEHESPISMARMFRMVPVSSSQTKPG